LISEEPVDFVAGQLGVPLAEIAQRDDKRAPYAAKRLVSGKIACSIGCAHPPGNLRTAAL
jgi:hypothetical protein